VTRYLVSQVNVLLDLGVEDDRITALMHGSYADGGLPKQAA
jgi:hypothetical protein